jgi:hypothetical protein
MVIISLLTVIFVSGQSVLFIGFYSKAEPGVDYWCRKSEIVKQVVASEAEAQQLAIEFKKEHKEESPYVKIIKKGAVVLFEFQRDNRAFHCKYRVIGYREGKTIEVARQNLERDRESIRKEYYGNPVEIYSWNVPLSADGTKPISCEDLVRYRDDDFLKLYDKKRTAYEITGDHMNVIKKLRVELEEGSRYTVSDWHLLTLTMKTLSNSLEDILGASSPQGKVLALASRTGRVVLTRASFLENIGKTKDAFETMTSEEVEKDIAIQVAGELGQVGKVAMFFKNLKDNVVGFKDFTNVQRDVKMQLALLDKAINAYNAKLKRPYTAFQEINNYKLFIDDYLKTHCGNQ